MTHVVGEQLRVEWNGAWYDARIVDVDGDRYRITYDGYDSSWDEWVTTKGCKPSEVHSSEWAISVGDHHEAPRVECYSPQR